MVEARTGIIIPEKRSHFAFSLLFLIFNDTIIITKEIDEAIMTYLIDVDLRSSTSNELSSLISSS